MAKAGQAQEPSMEEILASIRRIISDDDAPQDNSEANAEVEEPDMSADLSQDDLDKLFDSDGGGFDVDEPDMDEPASEEEDASEDDFDMAAAMAEDAVEDEADEEENGGDNVLELTEDLAMEETDEAPDMVEGLPEDTESGDLAFVSESDGADDAGVEEEPPARKAEAAAKPSYDYKPVRDDIGSLSPEDRLMSDNTDTTVHSAFASLSNTVLAANSRTLDELVREMLRPMIKGWLDDNLPTMVERMVRQEIERVTRGR
ncbi:hypothetical protein C8N35_1041 [Breoghania corrubedonensis]|uniref:Cell pole-organizing protein PopZ n=1 Tax=Breoghania corrubedonensis TaxID=665038 RepID=A0A2T5V9H3_9HYPH|nr:DUF2497 domain-containing protein [Breoghania corrubedonensis]PTW60381.1 hypothetical protein C8N35_1041 [Breoghania corrubedonensis]